MNLRLMTKADVPAGMRLKELAGWNQTPEDWERFLSASPEGCFLVETEGLVVGTVTTMVYEGRFAWIGMVLVDPEFRGRGIGTRLLIRAIEHLDALKVPTLKLDATPQGKPIYEKLDFVSEYEIERWTLIRPTKSNPSGQSEIPLRQATDRNDVVGGGATAMEGVLELDSEIFGADRSELLCSLASVAPDFSLTVKEHEKLTGYSVGRRGSLADHLGPWVAQTEFAARGLLDEFLRRSARAKVFVDCVTSNPWAKTLLRARGFEFSRPFTRMYRGPNHYPGRPEWACAVTGPEFG